MSAPVNAPNALVAPSDARNRYARNVLVAFTAIALAFVLATVRANVRLLGIESQTRAVSTNAVPSIERLVAANDALRDLESAVVHYPGLAPDRREAARTAIAERWTRVDRELTAYTAIPSFEGERELYLGIPAALRALGEAQHELLQAVDAGGASRVSDATDRVREACSKVAAEVLHLIKFNATRVYESTSGIEDLRRRTAQTALVLDGFAVLVAIAALAWLLHLYRKHTGLLQEHQALLERRANELESFGHRVAHDLLSPLTALTYCLHGFASSEDPDLRDAVKRARTCVARASTMAHGLLEFSRSGGEPDPLARADLAEVIEEVIDEIRAAERAPHIQVFVERGERFVLGCSRGVLVSILTNLLRNAAKFSGDVADPRVVVRVSRNGSLAYVQVQDNGPGVPPELRAAVFEPYVRGKTDLPGLGLGLATVKRLCDAHGGDVGVLAPLAGGATFWFLLPLAPSPSARPALDEVPARGMVRRSTS